MTRRSRRSNATGGSLPVKQRIAAGIILLAAFLWLLIDPLAFKKENSVEFFDTAGKRLAVLSVSGGFVSNWVSYRNISPEAVKTTLLLEDRRFWFHKGLDPLALLRAIGQNYKNREVVSGASTITQQLAKNILGNRRRTLGNKAVEALLAIYLELRYSKKQILENYFNRIYYGSMVGGIDTAAHYYFNKRADNLNIKEAVALALLARDPLANQQKFSAGELDQLINRRLQYLYQHRLLDQEHYNYYLDYELPHEPRLNERIPAPNLLLYLLKKYPGRSKIVITFDPQLQRYAEELIRREIELNYEKNIHNAAALIIENKTGRVLAYVGSADYGDIEHGGQIDGVQALRQPGSTLKPFLYYLALGNGFSPATMLPDIPISFKAGNGVYTPRNYDEQYQGPVSLRKALGNSLNIPAVYVLSKLGVEKYHDFLKNQLGFSSLDKPADYYGLGLTLGNAEVSLQDLVRAYVCLARGGNYLPEFTYTADNHGPTKNAQVLEPRFCYLINNILSDASARELAFGEENVLNFSFPAAAKTGTTKEFRDNWAVAYTPEVTVGVWVGNHNNREMKNSSGITGAGPIVHKLLVRAMQGRMTADFTRPSGILGREICSESGELAGKLCPLVGRELFTIENLPKKTCHSHQKKHGRVHYIYPEIYKDWLNQSEFLAKDNNTSAKDKFTILSPLSGTYYAVDPGIKLKYQQLQLQTNAQGMLVRWYVDGKYFGSTKTKKLFWPLRRGKHLFEAKTDKQSTRAVINVY